jgi:hypothetical protein
VTVALARRSELTKSGAIAVGGAAPGLPSISLRACQSSRPSYILFSPAPSPCASKREPRYARARPPVHGLGHLSGYIYLCATLSQPLPTDASAKLTLPFTGLVFPLYFPPFPLHLHIYIRARPFGTFHLPYI